MQNGGPMHNIDGNFNFNECVMWKCDVQVHDLEEMTVHVYVSRLFGEHVVIYVK